MMGRWAALILACLAAFLTGFFLQPGRSESQVRKLELNMEEIRSLNLLTSMYLTKEQKVKLIALSRQAQKARDNTMRVVMGKRRALFASMAALRLELIKGPNLKCPLYKQYKQVMTVIDTAKFAEMEQQQKLALEVEKILYDNQKYMIQEYKPCVIPVRSLASPQRVGQIDGCEQDYKWLQKVYEAPKPAYPKVKKEVLKMIGKELTSCNIPKPRVKEQLNRFDQYMEKAHRMPPDEFSIKKWDLVEGIGCRYIYSDERNIFRDYRVNFWTLGDAMMPETINRDKLLSHISDFMLSPAGLKALESIK